MLGTFVNAAAVVVGSLVGLAVSRGLKVADNRAYVQIMGMFVAWIGFQSTQVINSGGKFIVTLIAVILGAVVGELLQLEPRVGRVVHRLEHRFEGARDSGFLRAFVSSTLLFCVGPMAVLGAIQDGLKGDPTLLVSKAVLDGVTSVALAASSGIGVCASAISVLVYQGTLTLLARQFQVVFSTPMIDGISASGGMMLIFTGLNMIGVTRISVMNLLPALAFGASAATLYWR